ncbi:MAG: aldolase, partial [Chloroflexota bacterium]|nr:aldolase [Chloroflexota bacterium]
HHFPKVETAEIHLATGFQNSLYEHPAFPHDLHAEIEAWCHSNCADERKPGEADDVFVYKTRKKALGPYKRELWELPTKDAILADQHKKLSFLYQQLGIAGSKEMVARYVKPVRRSRPAPASLTVVEVAR